MIAFNRVDFHQFHPLGAFDRYGFGVKKVLEGVRMSIGGTEAWLRQSPWIPALRQVERLRSCGDTEKRGELKERIGRHNKMIMKCNKIWRAPGSSQEVARVAIGFP